MDTVLWPFLLPSPLMDDEGQLRHRHFISPGVSVLRLRGLCSLGECGAVVVASVSLWISTLPRFPLFKFCDQPSSRLFLSDPDEG
ncbi:hypothetical protein OROHE_002757 [Orobanche hederae]